MEVCVLRDCVDWHCAIFCLHVSGQYVWWRNQIHHHNKMSQCFTNYLHFNG